MATAHERKRREKIRLLAKKPWCRYCRRKLSASTATLEHVHPRSLGGTDARSNLALACRPCNEARGNNVMWSHRNPATGRYAP